MNRRTGWRSRGLAAALGLVGLACGDAPEAGKWVEGALPFAPRVESLGAFELRLEGTGWHDARLRTFHRDRPEVAVFETVPGVAFLEIGRGRAEPVGEGAVQDHVQERCVDHAIDAIEPELYVLRISGHFRCAVLERRFELFVVPEGEAELRFHLRLEDSSFNRIAFIHGRDPGERFFGLGGRETLEAAGRRFPVWLTPPGSVETSAPGSWRSWFSGAAPEAGTPVAVAHLLSSRGAGVLLENPEFSEFDLTAPDRVRVGVFARELTWRVQFGATPAELVAVATAAVGRAPAAPEASQGGLILRLAGGSSEVRRRLAELAQAGVRPMAVEVRDWFAPSSLQPDRDRYPDARRLIRELQDSGIRVLLEVGPSFPADPGDAATRDLVVEADTAGYWVVDSAGAPRIADGLRWLDLSNPDARSWWVDVLQTHVAELGAEGAVLTGGASLPWPAGLAADRTAAGYHNRYGDDVFRAAARAFRESERPVEGLLLGEAGFVRSPRHGAVFLAGDAADPRTWARLLSAGLSGFAHAAVDVNPAGSLEALERHLGLAAWSPFFRVEARALDLDGAGEALAKAARLHEAWAGYRGHLRRRASQTGLPTLRALYLHHPTLSGSEAFLVGDQLLVVPRFEASAGTVEVALPPGVWVDVHSGERHGGPGGSARVTLDAPVGRTPVLHQDGSIVGIQLRKFLATAP